MKKALIALCVLVGICIVAAAFHAAAPDTEEPIPVPPPATPSPTMPPVSEIQERCILLGRQIDAALQAGLTIEDVIAAMMNEHGLTLAQVNSMAAMCQRIIAQ